LKAERDYYKSLCDQIRSKEPKLKQLTEDTTTKIEDGRESASEGVVENIQEIENIVAVHCYIPLLH